MATRSIARVDRSTPTQKGPCGNDEGGWDVYVTETGEKICDDSTSWHFDVVFAIERHLNGEERVGQWRGPGPTASVAVKVENALRKARGA
jgi:hypothetical protein